MQPIKIDRSKFNQRFVEQFKDPGALPRHPDLPHPRPASDRRRRPSLSHRPERGPRNPNTRGIELIQKRVFLGAPEPESNEQTTD